MYFWVWQDLLMNLAPMNNSTVHVSSAPSPAASVSNTNSGLPQTEPSITELPDYYERFQTPVSQPTPVAPVPVPILAPMSSTVPSTPTALSLTYSSPYVANGTLHTATGKSLNHLAIG